MTDIPICALPQPDGICREPRFRMPDGTLAKRCEPHLGLNEVDPHDPFAGQRPNPSTANLARQAMIDRVAASISHLVERGVLRVPEDEAAAGLAPRRAAAVILDDLAVDVLSKTIEGMAVGSVQPS